jgi:mannose-6-phosphate isomerase-like protein (cupin superfamily)
MILRRIVIVSLVFVVSGFAMVLHAAQISGESPTPGTTGDTGIMEWVYGCEESPPKPLMAGTVEANARWTDSAPPNMTVQQIAIGTAELLPSPPARLSLARLEYFPHSGTPTRQATGPLLYVVESGAIDIFRSGERTRLGPGAFASVQLDQRYAFVNDSSVPARLLRLTLTPPDTTDEPVIRVKNITSTPGPQLTPPTRTLLFYGDIDVLSLEPVDLFIACVTWKPTLEEVPTYGVTGPVGLKLLEGKLRVDEQRMLTAGGCTLYEPGVLHRLQPVDGVASGLLFGVLATGQNLWTPLTDEATFTTELSSDVSCGDLP